MKIEPEKKIEIDEAKPGLFKRIFTKMDDAMKAKADEAAKTDCCSGKDSKGNKCC